MWGYPPRRQSPTQYFFGLFRSVLQSMGGREASKHPLLITASKLVMNRPDFVIKMFLLIAGGRAAVVIPSISSVILRSTTVTFVARCCCCCCCCFLNAATAFPVITKAIQSLLLKVTVAAHQGSCIYGATKKT